MLQPVGVMTHHRRGSQAGVQAGETRSNAAWELTCCGTQIAERGFVSLAAAPLSACYNRRTMTAYES